MNRIVQRTPVDTGRAKGNWNLAIGEMDDSTTENTDKSGTITIARARSRVANAKISDTIHIANGLPYIRPLEYHHSKIKAPAGMVRVTRAELRGKADEIARRING